MYSVAGILFFILTTGVAAAVPLAELIDDKARESAGSTMPDHGRFDILINAGAPEDAVLISAWWIDPGTGRFVANAVTDAGDVRRISGLATMILPAPVPLRRLMPGDIIAENDLGTIDLPAARVGAFTITNLEDLVGQQVRSLLPEGRPVMVQAVMQPLVIGRGDLVSIHYSDGALKLSAPGRSLADAHRGQDVRVVNLVSNAIVAGIASADGTVRVNR